MARYQWKSGGPKPAVEAQVFGDIVERLADGPAAVARPEDIVDAARHPQSPIHALFEWADDQAAELYRRQQARHWIGSLQIVRVQVSQNAAISNRAFFSVRQNNQRGYMPVERIQGDADLRRQVILSAREALDAWLKKFAGEVALGNFVPRLHTMLQEMQDEADRLVLDATRRRHAKAATEEVASPGLAP